MRKKSGGNIQRRKKGGRERGRRRKKNTIQLRSKRKEDDGPQVHSVNPHLGSHMMPSLHKAYGKTDG